MKMNAELKQRMTILRKNWGNNGVLLFNRQY
jgi:hypothetical protein